jgi:hypothetical protein
LLGTLSYENSNVRKTAVRAVQDHPSKRRGDDHLFQSKAQTEARLSRQLSAVSYKHVV